MLLEVRAACCACAEFCCVSCASCARRLFLRKLKLTLKIPVLALVDSDPYGLKILSVYMKGSMNMSYDSSNLTTPGAHWITGS
jgi:DNA topoisomerase VI subunit A